MSSTISFFDPKKKPFGSLSNNFPHRMFLDSSEWNTVTNYIFSNLLVTDLYKDLVKNTPVKNCLEIFNEHYKIENEDFSKKILLEAIRYQINQFPEIKELLQKTGKSKLIFASPDTFLGSGNHREGSNEYGKALMQVRHEINVDNISNEKNQQKLNKDQALYDIYLAIQILEKEITRNDNNLSEYLEYNEEEQYKLPMAFAKKHSLNETTNLSKETFLKMFSNSDNKKTQLFPEIKNYTTFQNLVHKIRAKELPKLRYRKISERNKIIFNMYVNDLIDNNYPKLEEKIKEEEKNSKKSYLEIKEEFYEKAKEQQFEGLSIMERIKLETYVTQKFDENKFPKKLNKQINTIISNIIIPSEDDIEIAKSKEKEIENKINDVKDVKEQIFTSYSEQILIYPVKSEYEEKYNEFLQLSPYQILESGKKNLSGMLEIKSKYFLTVMHYFLTEKIARLNINNKEASAFDNAYNNVFDIMFEGSLLKKITEDKEDIQFLIIKNIEKVENKYNELLKQNIMEKTTFFAKKGLDKKFENRVFQDILLATGSNNLKYEDFNNYILGLGPKNVRGENFVGKYLEELRDKLKEERKTEDFVKLTEEDIKHILTGEDGFVKEWFNMRIKDYCSVLTITKDYYYHKTGEDTSFEETFSEKVIDNIYQPCSNLYMPAELIQLNAPQYFQNIVKSNPGFKNIDFNVLSNNKIKGGGTVNIIWKRIAVLIYYLIKIMKDTNIYNIRTFITNCELFLSNHKNCEYIIADDYENCILSALLNIIKGIIEFNKSYSETSLVTEQEIDLAVSIILNKKYPIPKKVKQTLSIDKSKEKQEKLEENNERIKLTEQEENPPLSTNKIKLIKQDKKQSMEDVLNFIKQPKLPEKIRRSYMYSDDDDIDPNDFELDESFFSDGEDDDEDDEEGDFDMDNEEQDDEVVESWEELSEGEEIKPDFDEDEEIDEAVEDKEIYEVVEDKEIDDSIDVKEEVSDDILSSNAILIKEKLENIDEVQDKNKISILIENAIQKIKNDKLINKIKNNRINFFATLNYN